MSLLQKLQVPINRLSAKIQGYPVPEYPKPQPPSLGMNEDELENDATAMHSKGVKLNEMLPLLNDIPGLNLKMATDKITKLYGNLDIQKKLTPVEKPIKPKAEVKPEVKSEPEKLNLSDRMREMIIPTAHAKTIQVKGNPNAGKGLKYLENYHNPDNWVKALGESETNTVKGDRYASSALSGYTFEDGRKEKSIGKYRITERLLTDKTKKYFDRIVTPKELQSSKELQDKFANEFVKEHKDKSPKQMAAIFKLGEDGAREKSSKEVDEITSNFLDLLHVTSNK